MYKIPIVFHNRPLERILKIARDIIVYYHVQLTGVFTDAVFNFCSNSLRYFAPATRACALIWVLFGDTAFRPSATYRIICNAFYQFQTKGFTAFDCRLC